MSYNSKTSKWLSKSQCLPSNTLCLSALESNVLINMFLPTSVKVTSMLIGQIFPIFLYITFFLTLLLMHSFPIKLLCVLSYGLPPWPHRWKLTRFVLPLRDTASPILILVLWCLPLPLRNSRIYLLGFSDSNFILVHQKEWTIIDF